jgi:hypothetical protein
MELKKIQQSWDNFPETSMEERQDPRRHYSMAGRYRPVKGPVEDQRQRSVPGCPALFAAVILHLLSYPSPAIRRLSYHPFLPAGLLSQSDRGRYR